MSINKYTMTNTEYNSTLLNFLNWMCGEINTTNSTSEKLKILKNIYEKSINKDDIKWALLNTYSPYIKFGVTSEQVRKWMTGYTPGIFDADLTVEDLLSQLANRTITGHDALNTICGVLYQLPENYREVFYNILDKNLKIRMDAKSINKVIPDLIPIFSVSLCNVYFDRQHKVDFQKDMWLASRKLDGARCLTIIDRNGDIRFFSRQGKEFLTLGKLREQLSGIGLKNMVLDGEMCIVDSAGNENFKSIMKEITRKDHTIQNPMYKVFDIMTLEEFTSQKTTRKFLERYGELTTLVNYIKSIPSNGNHIDLVEMVHIENQQQFQERFDEAKAKGWEGLVIRKNDTTICKRSDSMLKVKAFKDAEYIVEDVEFGPFRVIKDGKEVEEDVMTNAYITHKGNRVSVGSGWSLEQRRLYKEHPEQLIGKTITVQYFEETEDKDGNISLRFPTCKMVYENGREI